MMEYFEAVIKSFEAGIKVPCFAYVMLLFICGISKLRSNSLNSLMKNFGVVQFIIHIFLLNKGTEYVIDIACITISHLAIESTAIRKLLKNNGICDLLMECINFVLPTHVVRNICRAMATLCIGNDESANSIKSAFLKGGMVERLVELTTTKTDISLIRSTCWAIENLIANNKSLQSSDLDFLKLFNNLLGVVKQLDFRNDVIISSHIICSLWYLMNTSDEVKQRLQDHKEEFKTTIIDVLKVHDTDLQIVTWGIDLLERLDEE
mmetsp:Transcript_32899/g.47540  ORF Transcript_32899/g.47540 Transcript_32899/m.47540 type:complete len:264 (+) Transcript_32899:36-827(+)